MKPLKELYELLWEQIKDKEAVYLFSEILTLKTSKNNRNILDDDLYESMGRYYKKIYTSDDRKEFVQRRIKELNRC